MYLAVLLPSVFALFALYKNKLTLPAIILSWIFGVVIAYFGDLFAFTSLVLTFILTIVSDKLKIKKKKDNTLKAERRNIWQIVCNVLIPALCIVIYKICNNEKFYLLYFMVICSSLADTLASSIGSLTNKGCFNPLNFKNMKKGESGAVSFLGLGASLTAGIFVGLPYFLKNYTIINYLYIILVGFLGAYFDSLLGYLWQGKFECSKCHEIVESKWHCEKPARLIKGINFIDNNVVNFLNNFFAFVIGYLFLIF
jgi:uncharacterized protein (TIGR00297 family)